MYNNYSIAVVAFYEASIGGHGAAEVTLSFYESLKDFQKKKLFEIKKYKIFKFFESIKINIFENIFKLIYLLNLNFKLFKFLNKSKKNIVVLEGASWIGYIYITIKVIKFFKPGTIFIYHSHNIEFYLRKNKNILIVALLTRILERKVFKIANISTVVSEIDQKEIRKLYKLDAVVLNNGVNKKRLITKKFKKNTPRKFIIFSGSYSFAPNRISIDFIIKKIFPTILKKYPEIKFVITGRDFPVEKYKDYKFIHYYGNLKKKYLNYLILKSKFVLAPMFKSTGTKLKIIEALMLGALVITSREGIKGIKLPKKINPPFVFGKYNEIYKLINKVIINNVFLKKKSKKDIKFFVKNYNMEDIVKKFLQEQNSTIT